MYMQSHRRKQHGTRDREKSYEEWRRSVKAWRNSNKNREKTPRQVLPGKRRYERQREEKKPCNLCRKNITLSNLKRHIKVIHRGTSIARVQIALEEKHRRKAAMEPESTDGDGSDTGDGGTGEAGTDDEAEGREDSGGALSGPGASGGTEDPSAEDSLKDSSRGGSRENEEDRVGPLLPVSGKRCSLCDFRASTETMMTCHLLDRHVSREDRERILTRRKCPSRTCSGNASNVHLGMFQI